MLPTVIRTNSSDYIILQVTTSVYIDCIILYSQSIHEHIRAFLKDKIIYKRYYLEYFTNKTVKYFDKKIPPRFPCSAFLHDYLQHFKTDLADGSVILLIIITVKNMIGYCYFYTLSSACAITPQGEKEQEQKSGITRDVVERVWVL